jgi:hypothetical protein
MPLPQHLLDELAERHLAEAAAERDKLRDYASAAAQCIGWCALGLFCIGWGLHTTDAVWGRAALYVGAGLGNGGWIFTVLAAYRRGERRGDW